uniref:Uncharacterized protein n=1 Tax=Brassica oleracea var. oleracea TaxID=109376 RepID=A0A0D3D6F8_BRAOL
MGVWTILKGPLVSFRVVYFITGKGITIFGTTSEHIQQAIHFSICKVVRCAPDKTDIHGLIMGNSKDICSLFESYLPNHEVSMHEITWRTFSTQLRSPSKKNQIKQSSYVTVMPFTNQVIIHVLYFQESLGLDGFQKDSKTDLFGPNEETDKILAKGKDGFRPGLKGTCLGPYQEYILHFSKSSSWLYQEAVQVKMFEADQRRLFSQFEVREFCDNLVEGVVKALKDASKIQKKSTTTRAPVAKPSLFIREKPKDSLPIFYEYDEELIEILMICEDNYDLPFLEPDFMFDKEQTSLELTFLQPEHPSSLVLFSQDFEEKPLDYPHQGPLLGTRRPMDVDLYPIFDEEDDHLDELGPTFDEKALSITSIIMENRLCFDLSTTPTPLSKEHCKELCIISSVPDMFDKVSSNDIKRSGLDHLENSFELDLQQLVFCSRKSFDSFVFKENSFSLRSYGHELITRILFASSYALDDFMVSTLLEQNSHKAETDFCGDSVLKPVHSYSESDVELKLLCFESDQVRNILEMFYGSSCLENILIYNTFFDKHAEPWIRNSQFELNILGFKSEKLVHVLRLFFRNYTITCLEILLVINSYFDVNFERMKNVLLVLWKEILISDLNKYMPCTYDPGILMFDLSVQGKQVQPQKSESIDRAHQPKIWRCISNPFQERGNDVPLGSAPGKTDMHGLIMGSSKDICSLFESYLPKHGACTHEITWRTFSTQLRSTSKKNQIKRSSYVTVMPFTNPVIFSSCEFRPPEKLEMANLLSDEPTTNSIMPKVIIHVIDVKESLGLDGFQKDSKTYLFVPNEETDKILAKGKDGFQPGLKGTCLGPYQEHILHFSKSWSWIYQEAVQDFI